MVQSGKRLRSRSRSILLNNPISIQQLTYLLLSMEEEIGERVTMEQAVERLINDEVKRRAERGNDIVCGLYNPGAAL